MKGLFKPMNTHSKHKNIALIGHMGSGKSLIGKLVAKYLDFKHLDSDSIIENKTKSKIKDIFLNEGIKKFRQIEEKTILEIKDTKKLVLSLGGGSILNKKVRAYLQNEYLTIFLDVDIEILVNRLIKSKKRPLLLNIDINKKIKELDVQRRKYYLLSDYQIKNHDSTDSILKEIIEIYKKNN